MLEMGEEGGTLLILIYIYTAYNNTDNTAL